MVRPVGILALQGDFELHQQKLRALGEEPVLVKKPGEVQAVSALIIPGGESTAFLRLLDKMLLDELSQAISGGLPTMGTCAGLILLAAGVANPEQSSLGLLDVDITRNAYGRQINSFIDSSLNWTAAGREELSKIGTAGAKAAEHSLFEGVFIRAPRISRVGKKAKILAERGVEPVMVKQENILGLTFHPELSDSTPLIHELLLSLR